MARNPVWTRDELILALDLYFRCGRKQLDATDPRIIDLSRLLNSLPIHPQALREAEFRNPNGVSMKLGNFLRLDPDYEGAGLKRGGRLEQDIWDEFASDVYRLHQVASAIKVAHEQVSHDPEEVYQGDSDEEVFIEGKILTRLHKQRERKPQAVKRKKQQVQAKTGRLTCEVCGFDFFEVYGELGRGFAECHHQVPIAQLAETQQTRLDDLAIVCANCHRMLHRSKPMLTINELRAIVAGPKAT